MTKADIYKVYLEEIEDIKLRFDQQAAEAKSTEDAEAFLWAKEKRDIDIQRVTEKRDRALTVEEGEAE